MTLAFDKITATTLQKYKKRLTDNVFTARPLSKWLFDKGRLRFEDGGRTIVEPLVYAGPGSTVAKSYSGWDTFSTTDAQAVDGITAAEYAWKQAGGILAVSGIEEAKNSGESAVLNLIESKVMQLEEQLQENFNTMFHADGTGNSGKDWDGLALIIDATATPVGGIAVADAAWWVSTETAIAGALTVARMTTLYNDVSKGNDHPDLFLTTQTLYEKYESLLQPQLRFENTAMGDAGFQSLKFKGATVMFDDANASGVMYAVNSKYIGIVGHSKNWGVSRGRTVPDDADGWYQFIKFYGNMTCRNRARQGKITGATA